jgi:hypothetical protein
MLTGDCAESSPNFDALLHFTRVVLTGRVNGPMPDLREFKPRVVPHCALAVLHGGLATAFGAGLYSLLHGLVAGDENGAVLAIACALAVVFAALFGLSAAALSRRVSLLFRLPRLTLSPQGLFARVYHLGFPALFRLWFRSSERFVAWAAFRDCEIRRVVIAEVPVKKSMLIESTGLPIEITWGMFAGGIEHLKSEILDFRDLAIVQPAREAARVPEFLSLVFRRPVIFSSSRLGRTEIAATIIVVPVAVGLIGLHLARFGFANALAFAALLTVAAVTVGAFILRRWISDTRFIQLSGDGITVGPSPQGARLIPWTELASVRVHAPPGSPHSSLTHLELKLRNNESFFIRAFPAAARLAALIDPPATSVRAAWRLIAEGKDAPSAARAVGMPMLK